MQKNVVKNFLTNSFMCDIMSVQNKKFEDGVYMRCSIVKQGNGYNKNSQLYEPYTMFDWVQCIMMEICD